MIEITDKNFKKEVIKSDELVLLDFYADWCGPCRAMTPVLNSVEDSGLKIAKVNTDENGELVEEYQVHHIPTFVFIQNGKEVDRLEGVVTQDMLLAIVKRLKGE